MAKKKSLQQQEQFISIEGARVNNLKNIFLKIPRDKLVVISGLSGSGKSSLAFETLFAEGQRRFAESLSSFARQFLGRMTKPAVDKIEGIPPAIAIEQKVNTRNPRSTVGTNTEIYDYLRLLYAKIGRTYSPVSGLEVKREQVADVLKYILQLEGGVYILAPIGWERRDGRVEKLLSLKEAGYSRVYNGKVVRIDQVLQSADTYKDDMLYLLVDRFMAPVGEGDEAEDMIVRIQDSVQSAFNEGNGHMVVVCEERGEGGAVGKRSERGFSNIFEADGIVFEEPSELMFSFNNPVGACPVCGGYGSMVGIDESLVIPNPSLSVYEGAVACWRGEIMGKFLKELIFNASKFDFPIHRPYAQLSKAEKDTLWNGNRYFTGINGFFDMVESQKYKIQYKYMLARYSGKSTCRECGGSRLRKETEYVKVAGRTISELMDMSISSLYDFFAGLQLEEYEFKIAERAIKEICSRLQYIKDVGLGYLTLNRRSNTLSGGESQRINLVSSLGSSLVGSMYILDEPSIGLHPRDTERLISVINKLKELGNTVVIVEHDSEIISSADYLVDIGPYAGIHGGEVVYEGSVSEGLKRCKELLSKGAATGEEPSTGSLTLDYLGGLKKMPYVGKERKWKYSIRLKGCMEHNLKGIDAEFPLNVLTVVTGVSGSGKSSLVGDTLFPALNRHFNQFAGRTGAFKELGGDLDKIGAIEYVDQNPIGKSSRSNPVTYLKIYDDIRKLFSEQPYAKMNGYGHSHFSFNIDGGRCPQCLGDGFITIPMQFMADVTMVCEECGGKRFKPDILEVRYKEKNINDILSMSVEEAIRFFAAQKEPLAKKIATRLKVLEDVGLGYVQLGQSSSSLSGGESQRVKLAQFLSKDSGDNILFIFDEPTTGLHFHDITKLLKAFDSLIEKGHTIVVVEHNTDVIKSADWIIDMGPDGGDEGGEIVFTGTPQQLAADPRWSEYLKLRR
ncbi:MAG: excinuclease ABC subunit UvrA [Bacteroidales bacterium]|nr:excinuclease ABC subunit UvrA [Bacteroidales bacterium]